MKKKEEKNNNKRHSHIAKKSYLLSNIPKIEIKKTLKYLWRFTAPYKKYFFLTYFFGFISILLGFFVVPLFIREVIDLLVKFNGENRAEIQPEIFQTILIILGINILAFWIIVRLSEYFLSKFVADTLKDAENFAFKRVIRHSTDFFADNFVGSLASKFGRFIRAIDGLHTLLYFNFAPNTVRFIAAISIVSYFSPVLGVMLFFWILVFVLIVFGLVRKFRMPLNLKVAALESEISGKNSDVYGNILSVKMFARNNFEEKFFGKTVKNLYEFRRASWFMWVRLGLVQSFLVTILEVSALYFMAKMWLVGTITIGTIVLIQGFLTQIYINLWGIGGQIQDFFRFTADADEMIEILEKKFGIKNIKRPEKCRISKGEIEFKKVNFDYSENSSDRARPVMDKKFNKGACPLASENPSALFKNFNLKIKAGEKIGLVGESGAGKSTITKLLLRFMDINAGEILIDGQNISKITQDNLREKISFVPQESVLFHRTLKENIQYGNLKSTQKEIEKAAQNAYALKFIKATENGWNTYVGERGIKLSGGEKQRIAMARAMLKKAPILILDEATSALDSKTENVIQKALGNLMKGKTTLVVAHRLSTLKKMDRILVLHRGKIIEEGTHQELLEKKGKYAELWAHQSGGFVE